MIVTKMFKELDSYEVVNDAGEKMIVTSVQIMQALLNGNVISNVILTKKGFGVKFGASGTRYKQLQLNEQAKRILNQRLIEQAARLETLKQAERQIKEQQLQYEKQIKRTQTQLNNSEQMNQIPNASVKSLNLDAPKGMTNKNKLRPSAKLGANTNNKQQNDTSKSERNPIVYKGTRYISVKQLIKASNSEVSEETFRERYKKGYSMDECLGFIKLRPESTLVPRDKREKTLDALDRERERRSRRAEKGED